MNLLINPNPKDDSHSVSGSLASRLAQRLDGETVKIRLYEEEQCYYHFQCREDWIDLLIRAERIIVPVPMWNYSIPAALKDFFDKVTKEGRVWKLGPQKEFLGLLSDRPVYIIMTSGLHYPPGAPQDFVVPYLRCFFDFLGIRNVRDFRVGGVAGSSRLVADTAYMNQKTGEMFQCFGLA